MRIRTENQMAQAVARHLNRNKTIAWREIKVGRCRFDVVAFDKKRRTFLVVECKLHSRPVSVGRTFGQIVTYRAILTSRGFEFLDATSDKPPQMGFGRWWEATEGGRRFRVEFYVALTDKACRQAEFMSLRRQNPTVGVIRVKPNGRCRHALRRRDGTADAKAAKARPTTIVINSPKAS